MNIDKIIVTHRGALGAKYGPAGLARVDRALAALVAADARRSLVSLVCDLADAAQMKSLGARVVADAGSARSVKAAIDKLCLRLAPHYVLLLGSQDIIPFVPLKNPAHGGADGDDDVMVPSDLPYACEAAYSTDPNACMGPSRVVGRLPDLPGAAKPTLLIKLIKATAAAKPRPRSDYQGYFGLSTAAWQGSTELSLRNTFGEAAALKLSPPDGPAWSKPVLAPRLHFINCHGAKANSVYYGQLEESYPPAHEARRLAGHIVKGTVLAAECCYGAELYDPARGDRRKGIALTYLDQGALGVFGSTTIAYGPSEGNGSADLITQFFLQQVLAGASLGRAALEARLQFAGQRTHLDPFDLKTLAQFILLGDPSVHPVAPVAHALTRTKAFRQVFAPGDDRGVRGLRREKLVRQGLHLAQALPRLDAEAVRKRLPAKVDAQLTTLGREAGLGAQVRHGYALAAGVATAVSRTLKKVPQRELHVISGWVEGQEDGAPVRRLRAVVATVEGGTILHLRRLHSR